jgi:hypothetical protein
MMYRLLIFCVASALVAVQALSMGNENECTTAVITGAATADGRPLLWKNRDADELSNRVVFVNDQPYGYLALVNAQDSSGRFAYAGVNAAGFAIMNSVAYNLPKKSGEYADLEGIVMGDVLRTCRTVDDFEAYIKRNLGPSLGCWTNFGVIDAHGGACIFEVHNHGYTRLEASREEKKCLLNTNFSRSGEPDKGSGYLRFEREGKLFARVPTGKITHEFILQTVARDVGHALLRYPERPEWKNLPADTPYWIHTNHTIDRAITASTIVIHGVKEGEDPQWATMWVILGEPLCSVAVPLWVAVGDPPAEVRDGDEVPMSREARRLKGLLRPWKSDEKLQYLNIARLDNNAGTGWLPKLLEGEREILQATANFLVGVPSAADLATFERRMAARALSVLRQVP